MKNYLNNKRKKTCGSCSALENSKTRTSKTKWTCKWCMTTLNARQRWNRYTMNSSTTGSTWPNKLLTTSTMWSHTGWWLSSHFTTLRWSRETKTKYISSLVEKHLHCSRLQRGKGDVVKKCGKPSKVIPKAVLNPCSKTSTDSLLSLMM